MELLRDIKLHIFTLSFSRILRIDSIISLEFHQTKIKSLKTICGVRILKLNNFDMLSKIKIDFHKFYLFEPDEFAI